MHKIKFVSSIRVATRYDCAVARDPAVNQDWVAKRIDPIIDVVPVPNGPLYACPTQTITLTATGAPDPSWTYKWYVLKDAAAAEFYAQNAASANLFLTAPQLFNNPAPARLHRVVKKNKEKHKI